MKRYRYIVVCADGTSWTLTGDEAGDRAYVHLPMLFEQGWRPVRETPMGGGDNSNGPYNVYALVLREKG
jgi:hypothetical protein